MYMYMYMYLYTCVYIRYDIHSSRVYNAYTHMCQHMWNIEKCGDVERGERKTSLIAHDCQRTRGVLSRYYLSSFLLRSRKTTCRKQIFGGSEQTNGICFRYKPIDYNRYPLNVYGSHWTANILTQDYFLKY